MIKRRRVDFPQPLGPINAEIRPGCEIKIGRMQRGRSIEAFADAD